MRYCSTYKLHPNKDIPFLANSFFFNISHFIAGHTQCIQELNILYIAAAVVFFLLLSNYFCF